MRIIVQKFGGTSVATPEGRQRAADRVEQAYQGGLKPVVVVSAMGRQGEPYATDTLLELAAGPGSAVAPRDRDLLAACGEVIASVVVGGVLRGRGLPVAVLTGAQAGIVTDDQFGAAAILRIETARVAHHLQAGQVVVVAGFQGSTEQGDVTTLGRGGSDTTASALGGALRAEVVEIYTDVDGIKTADPRIVPGARTLPAATYDEVAQMAHYGARVVHPRAVEIAMQANVPLRVKNTFTDTPGTLVTYAREAAGATLACLRPQGAVTAVTHVPGLAQVSVALAPGDPRARELFRRLAEAGISIDLINVYPDRKTFCIDQQRAGQAAGILEHLGLAPTLREGCAKVSVVGAGMRGRPGVMATVVEVLEQAGIEILQSADSHVTISCLVDQARVELAVQALHEGFGLGNPA